MAENIRVAREHRRLEANMNVALLDEILYVRTLRNRNILHAIGHGLLYSQNNRRQKPKIPPRLSRLQTN